MTAVMTDQVDVGWASPPFGLKEIDEGKIRLLARATDAAIVRGQTIRVIVANAQALEKRKDVIERYMQAYRETIDYMYSDNPQVLQRLRRVRRRDRGHGQARARRVLPARRWSMPDEIKGLDSLMADAVELKFIPAPLTKEQLAELVQTAEAADEAAELVSSVRRPRDRRADRTAAGQRDETARLKS